jgi:NTP pyrophosphatase (non-canonical NTP hydrolase)
MKAQEYQNLAARTLIDKPDAQYSDEEIMLVWNALKLAGEAGEIANYVGKGVFHRHGIDTDKMIDELGDVLWYVAAICTKLGVSLDEVMEHNIGKLMRRYPSGYSSEASKTRIEDQP